MIKKIIAGISALALLSSACATVSFAADNREETTAVYIGDGSSYGTEADEDGYQYITVNYDGGSNAVQSGTIAIKVTAGYFDPEDWGTSEKMGLNNGKSGKSKKYMSYTTNFIPNGEEGYDQIYLSFATDTANVTEDDLVFELWFMKKDGVEAKDVDVILYGETFQTDKDRVIKTAKEYTLKAGTSDIEEKGSVEPVPVDPTPDGTHKTAFTFADSQVEMAPTKTATLYIDETTNNVQTRKQADITEKLANYQGALSIAVIISGIPEGTTVDSAFVVVK